MNIALIGHGAMGTLIESLAATRGHSIVGVVDREMAMADADAVARSIAGVDAAIDFSTADAVVRNVTACVSAGVPVVVGTTGWNAQAAGVEAIVRNGGGTMIYGANFSIGVNIFYRVADLAAELFARFPEYEVFIEEQHHSRKKDAPSGTALKLREIVRRHTMSDFCITSTRAGNIPGTHRVGFDGPADQVLLEHTARSREGFVAGALTAAEWIVGKKGLYEFGEVIDEILKDVTHVLTDEQR